MSLTKEQRDALPAEDFAVPEKRALLMYDVPHTKMAWNNVDNTKDLTAEEKDNAKKNIIERAKHLGIDTSEWKADTEASRDSQLLDDDGLEDNEAIGPIRGQIIAMHFNAMAISFPDDDKDHPNKTPFSGILSRVDEPSDNPIGGSGGKRVILPKTIAEGALSSLLGMAIDFTANLDGHDAQSKIGIITEANIEGNALLIKGYFFGADFPNEVKRIQAEKSSLGFSYEAQVKLRSMNDDPLVIKSCIFTGAAVLYKNKAGYETTALNAKAEKFKMSDEILKMLNEMKEQINNMQANMDKRTLTAGSIIDSVKPHVDGLRACADGMQAAGIGTHPTNGHAIAINKIADHMSAAAAAGQLPHVYENTDFVHASNANTNDTKTNEDEETEEMKELKQMVASMQTEIADLKSQKFEAAGDNAEGKRKTTPTVQLSEKTRHLMAKAGINLSEKVDPYAVDEALANMKKLTVADRISIKHSLANAGLIPASIAH